MQTIQNALDQIVGSANFYYSGELHYGLMFKYFVSCLILCICISFVFKFILKAVGR